MATIAMTDQLGTSGCKVAWEVAKTLGLQYIDSLQIEEMVSKRLQLGHNALRRIVDGAPAPTEHRTFDREQISQQFAEQLIELAGEGDVILRCAGSAAILRPLRHVLCVRLHASDVFRARVIAERLHYQQLQMGYWDIESADAEQARWARIISNADWRNAEIYDAVLDVDNMSVAACVEAIVNLAQQREFLDPRASSSERIWRSVTDEACKPRCH